MENNENEIKMVGEFVVELNEQGPPGAPGLGITSVTEIDYDSTTGIYTYRITYSDDTYYDFDIHGTIEYNGTDGITVNGTDISIDNSVIPTQTDLQNGLSTKQDTIDSSNKLSSDLVDDTNATNKFATASQLSQISTNQSDISTINSKIPAEASSANKLTDKSYVDTADISLQDQINALKARGRFLALWDCSTGLAESNPPQSPYVYHSGDYFIVGTISTATPQVNYKPSGSSYTTGVASSTLETDQVDIDDVYYYDGSNWKLQVNTQKTVSFVNIAGDPYDNTNLATALNGKQDTISDLSDIRSGAGKGDTAVQPGDLATVATTGDYGDLLNKPTIPAAQIQSDWTQSDNTAKDYIKNKPTLSTVATSGDYNDLQNKPTIPSAQVQSDWSQSDNLAVDYIKNKPAIPTVNNGTITLTQGGVTKGSFTVNQSGNSTIDLDAGGGGGVSNSPDTNISATGTSTTRQSIATFNSYIKSTYSALSGVTSSVYSNGNLFVLFSNGDIYKSNDLYQNNRTFIDSLGYSNWCGLAFDGTNFIAINESGYVSISTDGGDTWSTPTQIQQRQTSFASIAAKNGLWIIVDNNGYIYKSTDNGSTWSTPELKLPLQYGRNALIYDGNNFINATYVSSLNSQVINMSSDGSVWTQYQVESVGNITDVMIAYGNGIYIYTNSYGEISTSNDAISWASYVDFQSLKRQTSNGYNIVKPKAISYCDDIFVSIDSDGYISTWDGVYRNAVDVTCDSSLSSTSTNPVQNKVINTALNNKQNKLYASTGITISGNTISINPDSQLDAFSTNAVQNAVVTAALNNIQPPSVSITGGNAISVGSGGALDYNNPTQIHPDPQNTTQWHAFCYDGTQYVAGGEFGEASVSTDCTNWNPVNTQIQGTITCIAFNAGKFVFAHNDSSISFVNSNNVTDSFAYNTTSSANNEQIMSVMASGQDFFYGGYDLQNSCGCIGNGDPSNGQIHMQSIQGISAIAKITNANGIDFGCGTDGNITYYDVMQNNWQVINVSQNGRILNIIYNGTNYIAIDEQGNIFTSNGNDYTQWQQTGSVGSSGVPIADFTSNGTDTLYAVSSSPFNPDEGILYVSDSNTISFMDYTYQTQGSTYTVYYGGGKILIGCEWGFAILYGGSGGYVINCIVDNQLDLSSTNPVENRVVTAAINNILDILQRNGIQ